MYIKLKISQNNLKHISMLIYFIYLFLVVSNVTDEEMQEHYDNFFEDVFVECEDKVKLLI